MTDEECEILELRASVQNLSEELLLSQADAKKFEEMYETLGARYQRLKLQKDLLWNEYCQLQVKFED